MPTEKEFINQFQDNLSIFFQCSSRNKPDKPETMWILDQDNESSKSCSRDTAKKN